VSTDPEPFDPQIARLLDDYAKAVSSAPSGRMPAGRMHGRLHRSGRRLRLGALVTIFVLGSATAAVAATAGGIIGFGTPRLAPGEPPPATPVASIGQPDVSGQLESGWVFAVDAADVADLAEVLLIDPAGGRVASRYPTGYDPEIAISPAGDVLYIASSFESESTLQAIDPKSGSELFSVPFPDRMMHTLPPVRSNLVVSQDGRWLFGAVLRILAPGKDEIAVAVFDLQSRKWTDELPVTGCLSPWLLARESGVVVVCPHDGRVFEMSTSRGKLTVDRAAPVGKTAAGAVATRDGLLVVSETGEVRAANATSDVRIGRVSDATVWPGAMVAVGDGSRLVIGIRGGLDVQGAVSLTEIRDDGKVASTHELNAPVWSLVGASDRVYATSGGALIVLDTTLRELARIEVGEFLAQPVVVP
jgi:DNA-binding beta-propeller fold protein YncE